MADQKIPDATLLTTPGLDTTFLPAVDTATPASTLINYRIGAAGLRALLGIGAWSQSLVFDGGALVADGSYVLIPRAEFAGSITTLNHEVGSAGGTFTVAVQKNGTAVAGLGAVAVSTAATATATATAGQTIAVGDRITLLISATSASPVPTGAVLTLRGVLA